MKVSRCVHDHKLLWWAKSRSVNNPVTCHADIAALALITIEKLNDDTLAGVGRVQGVALSSLRSLALLVMSRKHAYGRRRHGKGFPAGFCYGAVLL